MEENLKSGGNWLNISDIKYQDTFDLSEFRGTYAIGAADIQSLGNMACTTILFLKKDDPKKYIFQKYWLSKKSFDEYKAVNQSLSDILIKQDILKISGTERLEVSDLVRWFDEIKEKYSITIKEIGFDTWYKNNFVDEFESHGYKIVNVKKDFKTINSLMFIIERDLKDKICNFNNNLLLYISFLNTLVILDEHYERNYAQANYKTSISGVNSLFCAYKVLYNSEEHFRNMIEKGEKL